MDTLGIEAFLAVVRYGTITEAANSLFLSQSTLSHRLAELEKSVGVSLIERGRGQRSLSLTDYGKEFLMIARRWEDLVHDTNQIQSRVRNLTLAIGAVDTIHTYVLPPYFQALRQCGKDISLRLRTHNSTQLYLQIDRGELDVAFPLLDLPMRNIVVEKFFTEARVVLRREQTPDRDKEFIDPDRLDPAGEVFFEGDPAYRALHDRWKSKKNPPSVEVDTTQLLLPLMNNHGNWAIVPLCMAKKLAASGDFAYYRLEDPPPERICYKIKPLYPRTSVAESLQLFEQCLETLAIEVYLNINS
jgi:DNA-binding transcriptional LysR family regulator